jgi:hypothetical protein
MGRSKVTLIGYFVNGVQLRQASNIREWTREVFKKFPVCAWIECNNKSTDPHHIIRKGSRVDLKLVIENGVGFCRWHHRKVENMMVQRYWDLMELIVGKSLCDMLRRM